MAEESDQGRTPGLDPSDKLTPEAQQAIDAFLKRWLKRLVVLIVAVNGVAGLWFFNAMRDAAKDAATEAAEKKLGQFNFYADQIKALTSSANEQSGKLYQAVGAVQSTADQLQKNQSTTNQLAADLAKAQAEIKRASDAAAAAEITERNLNQRFEAVAAQIDDPLAVVNLVRQLASRKADLANVLARNDAFVAKVKAAATLQAECGFLLLQPKDFKPREIPIPVAEFRVPRPSPQARIVLSLQGVADLSTTGPPGEVQAMIGEFDEEKFFKIRVTGPLKTPYVVVSWIVLSGPGVRQSVPTTMPTTKPAE